MASLFTEADVAELRRLGWLRPIGKHERLGDVPLADDQLLMDLARLDGLYQYMHEKYGDVGAGEHTGFMSDIRDGQKDGERLQKAFDSFADRHETVISLYDEDGEFSELRNAITKMLATTVDLKARVGSRHDPKINPLKVIANHLIDLWACDTGSPPKTTNANRRYAAGKCLFYVIDTLRDTYGGEFTDKTLAELCRKATTKCNKKKQDQKKK